MKTNIDFMEQLIYKYFTVINSYYIFFFSKNFPIYFQ